MLYRWNRLLAIGMCTAAVLTLILWIFLPTNRFFPPDSAFVWWMGIPVIFLDSYKDQLNQPNNPFGMLLYCTIGILAGLLFLWVALGIPINIAISFVKYKRRLNEKFNLQHPHAKDWLFLYALTIAWLFIFFGICVVFISAFSAQAIE